MDSLLNLCGKKQVCGSCGWSEIPYDLQLKNKLADVNKIALSHGFTDFCTKIVASPVTSHYRNRMDFVIDYRGNFGLREKGKWWKVIDDHTCFIPDSQITDLYQKIYPWVKTCGLSFFDRKSLTGLLRYVIIRATPLGEKMVIVLTSEPTSAEENSKLDIALDRLKDIIQVESLIWSTTQSKSDISLGEKLTVLAGNEYITDRINGLSYTIRPNSFFQTNSHGAAVLQNIVLDLAKECSLDPTANLLDLYCGSGFFTLPLSRLFPNICGVESELLAIKDAEDNLSRNKLKAEFIPNKIENITLSHFQPDLILVDPPRAGLYPSVLKSIVSIAPKYLLYVSCKYEKFFEELDSLSETFEPVESIAVDMFPHTPHVELVTLLKTRNS